MIDLYCDESHDGTTYVLGGWLSTPHGWDWISLRWKAMLGDFNITAFHAAELVNRDTIKDSRYKGWTFDQEKGLFTAAVDILVDTKLCPHLEPFGCAVSLPPDTGQWIESQDSIWVLLFTRLLNALIIHGVENGISLMFDEKPEVREIVDKYYATAKETVDALAPGKLRGTTVTFGSDEHFQPLQAADLFAYEWRKRLSDRYLSPSKPPRRSYSRLKDGRHKRTLHYYDREAMRTIIGRHNAGESFIEVMWNYPTTED